LQWSIRPESGNSSPGHMRWTRASSTGLKVTRR
jgi:hypothetical protein